MEHNKYTIKDGEIIITTTIKIDDYSKLLRFNKNLYCLACDIRHSKSDEHFRTGTSHRDWHLGVTSSCRDLVQ